MYFFFYSAFNDCLELYLHCLKSCILFANCLYSGENQKENWRKVLRRRDYKVSDEKNNLKKKFADIP